MCGLSPYQGKSSVFLQQALPLYIIVVMYIQGASWLPATSTEVEY